MTSDILSLITREEERQIRQLRLIPSENYVSPAVRQAVGSVMMNKYSEGRPFKRYYQGNSVVDQIENRVQELALHVFGLDSGDWRVDVQAMSGSIANLAVYNGLLRPGDRILSMSLYDGGHLSHGWQISPDRKVSFTATVYEPFYYHVDPETRVFDYDRVEERAMEVKPRLIISGGTSYPREIDHRRMAEIAGQVGALYMADIAHEAGLVLAGVNDSPFPHADVVTMTTRKTMRGPIGAMVFARRELFDDIARALFPGLQGGPPNHTIAGIGVALEETQKPAFARYAGQVVANAQRLAQELTGHGYDVVSGGTDKHLLVIDLREEGLSGKAAAIALEKASIIVNKQAVPGEGASLWNPSGIRLGTPAVTTRGMRDKEMARIARWIDRVIKSPSQERVLEEVAAEVNELTAAFPVE